MKCVLWICKHEQQSLYIWLYISYKVWIYLALFTRFYWVIRFSLTSPPQGVFGPGQSSINISAYFIQIRVYLQNVFASFCNYFGLRHQISSKHNLIAHSQGAKSAALHALCTDYSFHRYVSFFYYFCYKQEQSSDLIHLSRQMRFTISKENFNFFFTVITTREIYVQLLLVSLAGKFL